MTLLSRLRKRQQQGETTQVAIVGAGLIGRGIVRQIDLTPGMRSALIVNRTVQRAVDAYIACGHQADDIIVSNDVEALQEAIWSAKPAVTDQLGVVADLPELGVVVEATGAVQYGAEVALCAIRNQKHVVMMNAETDATVGPRLKQLADEAGVVYTNSDGDQPGVLKRLVDYVDGIGLEVVAAVNCKGFLDAYATPDTIRPWAERQHTSLPMTTAFTDGTKMNIENAVLANATGLVPEVRGMHGVTTELATALEDCLAVFGNRGLVDYTLGGDFGGGVFVIGYGVDPVMIQPYMKYLKMGDGPNYLFYRPYHLCHMDTPLTIAEAVLDGEPTIAPRAESVAEVIAIAKRDLRAGERLDGIGGYTCFGRIDEIGNAGGLLPIGLTENVLLTRPIQKDAPVPLDAVELDDSSLLMQLRREQMQLPAVSARRA